MADLDVQRKKKSPLPWILIGLLLLAVLAYFLWNRNRENNMAPATYDSVNQTGVDTVQRQ
jgi:hypothetical protein